MRMSLIKTIVAALILLNGSSSFAFRCGNSLVYEGDSKYLVLKKCGKPLAKDVYSDPNLLINQFNVPYGIASDIYEVWTYQPSPNDFIYEVLFQSGHVVMINANRAI
ncbi:Protein of uncharacterised function (DUF2845) [Legionella busanensis]|uniref:Protein of uncharacterized function (DUF2845) n=2 Tax=Legionella busanensis TaxID=190655 RepID=A0A378JPQ9_9GAMM|nr:Protein of uncharacterised function (DUF2845) [Legionella busanensis]